MHGKGSYKYDNVRIGWNSRLDTIQAAVLLVKFKAFQAYELEAVNTVASWYTNTLGGDAVKTPPVVPEGCYSSWAQYTIQLADENQRTEIQGGRLKEQGGIPPTMVYYPKPMHEQTAFKGLKQYVQCPVTERLSKTVVSLPLDGYKTSESCITVSAIIKSSILMV